MTQEAQLPPGWQWATFSDVAEWGSGGTPKADNPTYYGGSIPWAVIGDLTDGVVTETETTITERGLAESAAKMIEPGTIMVAMYGSIGKLGLAAVPMATNQAIAFARPKEGVEGKYLFWFLRHEREALNHAGKGATQRNISQTVLKPWPIPIAPTAEQRRIVAAIEELLSRIDAGLKALSRARQNLQRMRAAVLQAAVTGQLVPQDPEAEHAGILVNRLLDEHPEARNHALKLNVDSLPRLPAGWAWLAVGQLGEVLTGRTPDTKRAEYFGSGLPFVTPGDMGEELILGRAARELTDEGAAEVRRLPANSVLVTCIGATIGKVGLAVVPCATNQQINALIPFESYALSRWVCYAMASPWFFELLRSQASSTTMPILNKSRFQTLPIPLPPIPEQARIVTEVERHLSVFDNLKVVAENNIEHTAQLRRSILGSGFAGRLVPQDRSDEPASVLLARVGAARITREPRHTRSDGEAHR